MKFNKLYDDDNSVKGYKCEGYYIMKHYIWMNNYSWIINKDGKSWYADCEFWKLVDSGDIILCLNLKEAKQKVEKLLNAQKNKGEKIIKKVRISKEYGIFYYEKIMDYDLDAPIYEVYDSNKKYLATCGCYDEMIGFIKSGCDENSLYM